MLSLREEWRDERRGFHSRHGTEDPTGGEGGVGKNRASTLLMASFAQPAKQGKRQWRVAFVAGMGSSREPHLSVRISESRYGYRQKPYSYSKEIARAACRQRELEPNPGKVRRNVARAGLALSAEMVSREVWKPSQGWYRVCRSSRKAQGVQKNCATFLGSRSKKVGGETVADRPITKKLSSKKRTACDQG